MTNLIILGGSGTGQGGVQTLTKLYATASKQLDLSTAIYSRGQQENENPTYNLNSLADIINSIQTYRKKWQATHGVRIVMPDTQARIFALATQSKFVTDIYVIDSVRFSAVPKLKPRRLLTHVIENFIIRNKLLIATYSEAAQRLAQFTQRCLGVLYTPLIDVPAFEPKTTNDQNTLHIGFMGRLEKEKGADRLESILDKLDKKIAKTSRRAILHICGDGTLRPHINRLRNNHYSRITVIWHGFVTDQYKYMKEWDVLLLPSRTEGASLVCAEAAVNGLPTCMMAIYGNGPQETAGSAAFSCAQGNYEEFCDNILAAANLTGAQRKEIAAQAIAKYSKTKFEEKLKDILSRVLNSGVNFRSMPPPLRYSSKR